VSDAISSFEQTDRKVDSDGVDDDLDAAVALGG
jgi:hypothetical protein